MSSFRAWGVHQHVVAADPNVTAILPSGVVDWAPHAEGRAPGSARGKFRLALTATAVLLGVMFVTTTYVLTDTLDESFDRVFAQSLSDVDVVVRARR